MDSRSIHEPHCVAGRVANQFFCEEINYFPYACSKEHGEWVINCVWGGNAPEEIAHSLANSTIGMWIENETPNLAGKQIRQIYIPCIK